MQWPEASGVTSRKPHRCLFFHVPLMCRYICRGITVLHWLLPPVYAGSQSAVDIVFLLLFLRIPRGYSHSCSCKLLCIFNFGFSWLFVDQGVHWGMDFCMTAVATIFVQMVMTSGFPIMLPNILIPGANFVQGKGNQIWDWHSVVLFPPSFLLATYAKTDFLNLL